MYFSTHDIYSGHEKKFIALSLLITILLFVAFPLMSRFESSRRHSFVREIASVRLPQKKARRHSRKQDTPPSAKPPLPAVPALFRTPSPHNAALTPPGPAAFPAAQDFSTAFGLESDPDDINAIFDFTQIDVAPKAVKRVLPAYPLKARILGIEGSVELSFVVRPDGSVEQLEVVSATPEGMFERVALAAVGKWKYAPAQKDGANISARVRLPLKFNLRHRGKTAEETQ